MKTWKRALLGILGIALLSPLAGPLIWPAIFVNTKFAAIGILMIFTIFVGMPIGGILLLAAVSPSSIANGSLETHLPV